MSQNIKNTLKEPDSVLPEKPLIVVVDDEQGFRDLLSYELGSRGYKVLTCANGNEALKCVKENEVDLVVSDIMMPVMNGLEMLAAVKKCSPQTEIILITGNGSIESAIESMKRGAYDYITKPYQVDDLVRIIKRAIEKRQLNRQVDRLEEVNRLKTEFLANMSHELRTPMNAIIGYSSLLLDGTYGEMKIEQTDVLRRVEINAKTLLGLINDVLDLSKLNAGRMLLHPEECNLQKVLEEIVDMMSSLAVERNLILSCEAPKDLWIRIDRTKLKQILVNLVGNALKFTHQGGVEIRAVPSEDGSNVHIKVTDTGIGINPDDIPSLFEEFRQLDSSTQREYGGTGLGLAITKKLMNLLKGTIEVESSPGKGSVFSLIIPAETVNTVAAVTSVMAPHAEATAEPVILGIDDDDEMLVILRDNLRGTGFKFISARSAEEGLAMAKKYRPTVITLDIMMPQKDGWWFLRSIKNDPELKEIPIIVVSNLDNKPLGFSLGVVDYIVKPVERTTLLKKLTTLAGEKTQRLLVVDDDEEIVAVFSNLLSIHGYSVETARNGREALTCIQKNPPDVLFLDLIMPQMTGFELLLELERNPEWRKIKVVVVSEKTLGEAELSFIRQRAEMVLSKSARDLPELVQTIKERLVDLGHRDSSKLEKAA